MPKSAQRWVLNLSTSTKVAGVEEEVDALAGGELAGLVLAGDALLAAAALGGLVHRVEQRAARVGIDGLRHEGRRIARPGLEREPLLAPPGGPGARGALPLRLGAVGVVGVGRFAGAAELRRPRACAGRDRDSRAPGRASSSGGGAPLPPPGDPAHGVGRPRRCRVMRGERLGRGRGQLASPVEQLDEHRHRVGVAEPRQRPGGPRRP